MVVMYTVNKHSAGKCKCKTGKQWSWQKPTPGRPVWFPHSFSYPKNRETAVVFFFVIASLQDVPRWVLPPGIHPPVQCPHVEWGRLRVTPWYCRKGWLWLQCLRPFCSIGSLAPGETAVMRTLKRPRSEVSPGQTEASCSHPALNCKAGGWATVGTNSPALFRASDWLPSWGTVWLPLQRA